MDERLEGSDIASTFTLKSAYFVDGKITLDGADAKIDNVSKKVDRVLGISILVITSGFCLIAIYIARNVSRKITNGVVQLYENLQTIQNKRSKNSNNPSAVLSFKLKSEELNELHLTFNKAAKIMMLS